jgi:hypothetical protein
MVRLTGLLPKRSARSALRPKGSRLHPGIQLLGPQYRDQRAPEQTGKETSPSPARMNDGPFLVRFYQARGKPNYFWTGSPWTPLESPAGATTRTSVGRLRLRPTPSSRSSQRRARGRGRLLARITPDGVLDPSYPPQQLYGGGKLIIRGLLAASDGTVLVTLLKQNPSETYTANLVRYR